MSVRDVDGLNTGYAQALLEQYLENPEAVPEEWRSLFESGDSATVEALPGLARLLETLKDGNGASAAAEAAAPAAVEPPSAPEPKPEPEPLVAEPPTPAPDETLLGGVAAASRETTKGSRCVKSAPSVTIRPADVTRTTRVASHGLPGP